MAWVTFIFAGTASAAATQDSWDEPAVEIHGLTEIGVGSRVTGDQFQPDDLLFSEVRFRLDLSHFAEAARMSFKGDLVADAFTSQVDYDVREALVTVPVAGWLDVRAGRQVMTWGTGDFVFLNDLFPKDFVSFFIGRDDEFLKAPANAVKFTFYSRPASLDFVWTPVFEPDRFITGERLTFFDRSLPGLTSATTSGGPLEATSLPMELGNGEFAARLHRTLRGYELALYGYVGFTKQPLAMDAASPLPTYSRLTAPGASIRGNLLGGIVNLEGVYYASPDSDGTDSGVPNSEIRTLAGYEREIASNLTLGLQYYAEWIQDYDGVILNSQAPGLEPERVRHMLTTRVTSQLRRQTLTLSAFAFISPSDGDAHFRPVVTLRSSDAVTVSVGANVMLGKDSSFFGQLRTNSNAYLRLRYGF